MLLLIRSTSRSKQPRKPANSVTCVSFPKEQIKDVDSNNDKAVAAVAKADAVPDGSGTDAYNTAEAVVAAAAHRGGIAGAVEDDAEAAVTAQRELDAEPATAVGATQSQTRPPSSRDRPGPHWA
ncbi:hypothetical protein KEM55_003120 [Ascosphaera atra]|nr:hypothetical protein KEM55_003120 [Ascosphaera atra]